MLRAAGTLSAEFRIVLYIFFAAALFIFPYPVFYFVLSISVFIFLFQLPLRTLKAGWIPVSMFLFFTFAANLLNHPGRIIYSAGPLLISLEGLHLALIRTVRVVLMIGGVKLLMAGTPADVLINAMARLLYPLAKIGLPVKDFFHAVGLTMQCFPILQDYIIKHYNEHIGAQQNNVIQKARLIAAFLLPLFVESIRHPELFFSGADGGAGGV